MITYELHYRNQYSEGWKLLHWTGSDHKKRFGITADPTTRDEAIAFAKIIYPNWIDGTQFRVIEVIRNEVEIFVASSGGTTMLEGEF